MRKFKIHIALSSKPSFPQGYEISAPTAQMALDRAKTLYFRYLWQNWAHFSVVEQE